MKNITLSMPDELVRQGREYAARQGTTLNALIRKLLKSTVQSDQLGAAKRILDEMERLQAPAKHINWIREDLYER